MAKNSRANVWKLDWTNPVTGETVSIAITHTRNYLVKGTDHIEVRSVKPARAPLPITDTGYLSHFAGSPEVINAGGPIEIVKSLLHAAERSAEWRKKEAASRQGDLFAWASKQATVKGETPKPKRPAAKSAAKKRKPAPKPK